MLLQPVFNQKIKFAAQATLILVFFGFSVTKVGAWENHTLLSYRAFERMPEIVNAPPVKAESLDAFLKAEEKSIEKLLDEQEIWAIANIDVYPPRPPSLDFKAEPARTDVARRIAFFKALRIAQNSRFAPYIQPDPQARMPLAQSLRYASVSTLPEPQNVSQRFIALPEGEMVTPLQVIASASDEPDYGLDINCWDDSPGEWGKTYGFGALPFGNPALPFPTQGPFHMGLFYESWVGYNAAPFLKRTFILLRVHQYSTLSALAFRTGHAYWGWRFSGLALHYVQDLTQPYHASIAPGYSNERVIEVSILAMMGLPERKKNLTVLISNSHFVFEQYQLQMLQNAAWARQDTPFVLALQNGAQDESYPTWSDAYLRDVVARQAHAYGDRLSAALVASMPAAYVTDPGYDFGAQGGLIDLVAELSRPDAATHNELDVVITELLGNFGSHSRNFVRGILCLNRCSSTTLIPSSQSRRNNVSN